MTLEDLRDKTGHHDQQIRIGLKQDGCAANTRIAARVAAINKSASD